MRYTEYIFNIKTQNDFAADVLISLLGDCGFESFTQDEQSAPTGCAVVHAYVQTDIEDAEAVNTVIATASEMMSAEISFSATPAAHDNWNRKWEEEGYKPVVIDCRLLIHSTMHHDDTSQYDYVININPRLAFGTGTHPTTQMLLTWILDNDVSGLRVIDAGCGTGILGILVMLKGGKSLIAYDIDEWSCDNTNQNLALNGIVGDVRLGNSFTIVNEECDLLIANINRNILIADMEQFGRVVANNGVLLLSGFYQEDIELLVNKAKECGFSLEQQADRQEWRMLQFRKSS